MKRYQTEWTRIFPDILGDRDVVHVFLHGVSGLLPDGSRLGKLVPGIWDYADRALAMARAQDIVCLPSRPDAGYLEYLSSFDMGPHPGRIVVASDPEADPASTPLSAIVNRSPEGLLRLVEATSERAVLVLNPFVLTSSDLELAVLLERSGGRPVRILGGPLEVRRLAGQKTESREMARQLEIPVPPGEVIRIGDFGKGRSDGTTRLEARLRKKIIEVGVVVLKGAGGASGSSTWVVTPESPIEEVLGAVRSDRMNREFILEPRLPWSVSPNLLFFLGPDRREISYLGATDQKVDGGLVHQGNVYPSRARSLRRMIDHAVALCDRLRRQGYAGFAGFDFIEVGGERGGEPAPIFCEINPRINAATYLLAVRDRVNRHLREGGLPELGAFSSVVLNTRIHGFDELCDRLAEDMFQPCGQGGTFPLAAGPLKQGKALLCLLAPTPAQVRRLEGRVLRRLAD